MKPSFDQYVAQSGQATTGSNGAIGLSPWRYLRRLETERAECAIKDGQQFRAPKVGGQVVDDVHNFQGGAFPLFVVRRMDSDKFAKLQADMAQARKDRIAFRTHISPEKKTSSLALALRSAGVIVAGCLFIMSGPILAGLGIING